MRLPIEDWAGDLGAGTRAGCGDHSAVRRPEHRARPLRGAGHDDVRRTGSGVRSSQALDSSGAPQYRQLEFGDAGRQWAAIKLLGVESGTTLDHTQAHPSGAGGIRFARGVASGTYCVADSALGRV